MFTTVEMTKRLTGYEVTLENLYKAQAVVETYCGRVENDIVNMRDKALLARATAYQAAYMRDNADTIFEQVAAAQVGQSDSIITYKGGDDVAPFVAPLAVMACKKLSWFKSRSVRTGASSVPSQGGYFNRANPRNWWND